MWQTIIGAPFKRPLQLAVVNQDGMNALVFPCEKTTEGGTNVKTGIQVDIWPTHWREWSDSLQVPGVVADANP